MISTRASVRVGPAAAGCSGRRLVVAVRAQHQEHGQVTRRSLVLGGAIVGLAALTQPAFAAELTAFEKKQIEAEKRKAALAAKREAALAEDAQLKELRQRKRQEAREGVVDPEVERKNEERRLDAERSAAALRQAAQERYNKAAQDLDQKFGGLAAP